MAALQTQNPKRRACACIAVLIACLGNGGLLHAGDWRNITECDGVPVGMVQFMKRIDNDVWVGALDGLVQFTDGTGTKIVSGQAVWAVLCDGKDRYWLGTDQGILLLEGGKISQSLTGASVGCLKRFGEQAVWAVAGDRDAFSLREWRDNAWRVHPHFKGKSVSDLFTARDGTVWALVESDGIVAADPARNPAEWVHHLQGVNVRSFCEDDKGRIWCGTWGRGIKVLEGVKWTSHLAGEEAAITAIVQDGDGHLWAATNANGLWEYDGTEWHNHLRDAGSINVLECAADGRVYVSSQSVAALRVWDGQAWTDLVTAPGGFRTVVIGPDNKLWAGHTLSGIYVQP